METDEKPKVLTGKQRAFVDAYCGTARFNATEAARQAGYTGSDGVLRSVASENLTKPNISQEICDRMAALAMPAAEVLARLADVARGYGEYLSVNDSGLVSVDAARMLQDGKGHLIKGVKTGEFGQEVLMHDGLTALVHIGKHHKLFVERRDITSGDQPVKALIGVDIDAI